MGILSELFEEKIEERVKQLKAIFFEGHESAEDYVRACLEEKGKESDQELFDDLKKGVLWLEEVVLPLCALSKEGVTNHLPNIIAYEQDKWQHEELPCNPIDEVDLFKFCKAIGPHLAREILQIFELSIETQRRARVAIENDDEETFCMAFDGASGLCNKLRFVNYISNAYGDNLIYPNAHILTIAEDVLFEALEKIEKFASRLPAVPLKDVLQKIDKEVDEENLFWQLAVTSIVGIKQIWQFLSDHERLYYNKIISNEKFPYLVEVVEDAQSLLERLNELSIADAHLDTNANSSVCVDFEEAIRRMEPYIVDDLNRKKVTKFIHEVLKEMPKSSNISFMYRVAWVMELSPDFFHYPSHSSDDWGTGKLRDWVVVLSHNLLVEPIDVGKHGTRAANIQESLKGHTNNTKWFTALYSNPDARKMIAEYDYKSDKIEGFRQKIIDEIRTLERRNEKQ